MRELSDQAVVEHTDLPYFSQQDVTSRERVRQQIVGSTVSPLDNEELPVVEITGLELLGYSKTSVSSFDDDESYDSYAEDSFVLLKTQWRLPTCMSNHRQQMGRMSNCSSIEEDDAENWDMYGYVPAMRRSSLSSHANESLDYGRYRPTRRSSAGSYANDSLANVYGYQQPLKTRRSSLGSYKIDREDFNRCKATRRASVGSYANDSVDFGRYNDSIDFGRYKATRRGSMSSYANDSVEVINRAKAPRRFSQFSDYANDSFDLIRNKSGHKQQYESTKRRMSNASYSYSSAFSDNIYETQTINTGGAGRAA